MSWPRPQPTSKMVAPGVAPAAQSAAYSGRLVTRARRNDSEAMHLYVWPRRMSAATVRSTWLRSASMPAVATGVPRHSRRSAKSSSVSSRCSTEPRKFMRRACAGGKGCSAGAGRHHSRTTCERGSTQCVCARWLRGCDARQRVRGEQPSPRLRLPWRRRAAGRAWTVTRYRRARSLALSWRWAWDPTTNRTRPSNPLSPPARRVAPRRSFASG